MCASERYIDENRASFFYYHYYSPIFCSFFFVFGLAIGLSKIGASPFPVCLSVCLFCLSYFLFQESNISDLDISSHIRTYCPFTQTLETTDFHLQNFTLLSVRIVLSDTFYIRIDYDVDMILNLSAAIECL